MVEHPNTRLIFKFWFHEVFLKIFMTFLSVLNCAPERPPPLRGVRGQERGQQPLSELPRADGQVVGE